MNLTSKNILMVVDKLPTITREGYEQQLHIADDNPYLNYEALEEACEAIFGDEKAIPYEQFKLLTESSYRINMEDYAKLHNFIDAVKLAEYFAYVMTKINQKIANARTNRVIVVGCGQGRLAEIYIALAKKLGIKEITFNDLIESHIIQTEQKIKMLYGSNGSEADGVRISYLPGDFAAVDVSGFFDAAFLFWFVSAELLDPSSVENIRLFRHQVYSKMNGILIPEGGLIEDIPDPNMEPGFFEKANFKTADILKRKGILIGEHQNLLLSNWTSEQQDGFRYQLRYTPRNGTDMKEKMRAGFRLKKTESISIPSQSMYRDCKVVLNTLEDVENIWDIIPLLQQLILQTIKMPAGDEVTQKRRKITWWEKAGSPAANYSPKVS